MSEAPSRRATRLALVSSLEDTTDGRPPLARGRELEAPVIAEDVHEATNRRYVHGSMTPREALEQVVYDPFYPLDLRHAAALELMEALREPKLRYVIEHSPELWEAARD
jgi:hypothetical protein